MKSFKVKLALCAAGILVLLAVGIFVFIKLSMVNVPVTTFTRKDFQKLPLPFIQIAKLLQWNEKTMLGIGAFDEFKLYVLESNNRLELFHRISQDMIVKDAFVDKQNRLILSGTKKGEFCINVFTSDNALEVTTELPKQISANEYSGVVQSSQAGNQFLNASFTSNNILYWLNEPDGQLHRWDINGETAKALPSVFLPKIAKLETPSGAYGINSNFWRICGVDSGKVMVCDCLGHFKRIDLKSMKVFEISPPKVSVRQPYEAQMRIEYKDKRGRIWEIRDLPSKYAGEINCEVTCLDGKNVIQRSMVVGTRDGQQSSGGTFVENIFGAFHFHNLKESVNWNFPPTIFRDVLEDKLGNIYLRTDYEGFFKLLNNKWVRYSSPSLNSNGTTVMHGNQLILTNDQGQILRYDLAENTCESLELTTESNSDTYNRGPGLVGYPGRSLRMETVRRDHPQQVYPRYSY